VALLALGVLPSVAQAASFQARGGVQQVYAAGLRPHAGRDG
jgi:hypothetical protein